MPVAGLKDQVSQHWLPAVLVAKVEPTEVERQCCFVVKSIQDHRKRDCPPPQDQQQQKHLHRVPALAVESY